MIGHRVHLNDAEMGRQRSSERKERAKYVDFPGTIISGNVLQRDH